jgi:hypothetical protein
VPYIADAVMAMTHRKKESYEDYITRLSYDSYATAVKIADLEDNLNDLEPGSRRSKYLRAWEYLKEESKWYGPKRSFSLS